MPQYPTSARRNVFAAVLTVAALTVVSLTAGCGDARPAAPDTAPAIEVAVTTVDRVEWPSQFDAGGVLQARMRATVASQLMAVAVSVDVRAGDVVRRGQRLIELDGAALVAGAARASAAATAARESAAAADADVAAMLSSVTLADATHTRVADLAANRAATAQELDQAVAARAIAAAQLAAARARQRSAAAALAAAVAGERAAVADAAHLTLTAPFDGIVTDRAIDPGSMALPGVPLLVIDAAGRGSTASPLQLQIRLDASRAAAVTTGQAVEVRIDDESPDADAVTGRVTEISRMDIGAHNFGVKIDVAGPASWRAGLFGRARFTGAPRRTLAIPASAVVRRGQLAFVFVAADAHARLRAISLGDANGTSVEVLDGLAAGEHILSAPPEQLADGARITTSGGAR